MGGFPNLKRLPSQHRIKDYGVSLLAETGDVSFCYSGAWVEGLPFHNTYPKLPITRLFYPR